MDGEMLLPLNAGNREAAGLSAGDVVEVSLELDTAPRVVELAADAAKVLGGARSPLRKHFDSLSFTHQREWAEWIESAKRPETRERRISGFAEAMRAGKRGRN